MQRDFFEANFDGLVGPTHHYAGLSFGNVASTKNARQLSNPKRAALQGLSKAVALRDLGIRQGVLPPLRRPRLDTLRALGFTGSDASVIERAFRSVPQLLSACYSASSMWVANAATFSPEWDTLDGRPHFTPANLRSKFHRSLEPKQTGANLRTIFPERFFSHHDPIVPQFGDEGAANFSRLVPQHGRSGLEIFVYGASVFNDASSIRPKKFPARQSFEASSAVAANHGLAEERTLFLQQHPDAIDSGVFHNDVISVANENVLLVHEKAYAGEKKDLLRIREKWENLYPGEKLDLVEILEREVSLEDAVRSYLFNSQLLTLPSGKMALVCPEECRETPSVAREIERIISSRSAAIERVLYFDLRESMQNGGGPACLRLRVALSKELASEVHPGVWLSVEQEGALRGWIEKHYRDRLSFEDLRDPKLYGEVHAAMDALETILALKLA